jgi:Domain of unknown function (DUF6894)
MPRFHFHLSACDQSFRDNIGCDVTDLAAAHSRAVQLAYRVMMLAAFADCPPDMRRWTVQITDGGQRPVITVIVPAQLEIERCKPEVSDARTLQQGLKRMLEPAAARRLRYA